MKKKNLIVVFLLTCICSYAQPIPRAYPSDVGMDVMKLGQVDPMINKSIADKEFPGAVLGVVRYGRLVYLKAYGNRQIDPNVERMTTNTVFDLASLTKPIATALSMMILVENGEIRLLDDVSLFIPDFEVWKSVDGKKKPVKIIDLLTHTSGLPAYAPMETLKKNGTATPKGLLDYINTVGRKGEPATVFIYSDLNYVVLQAVIESITKQSLQEYSKEHIFNPLGMTHTDYKPNDAYLRLIAPTEKQKDNKILKGEVHDPLARIALNGVSGNAGLFSDAEDLAILATMMMDGGKYNNKQIISPLSIKAMRTVPRGYEEFGRTLGWDNYSPYASNNGDLFSPSTYGHSGYTGTSMVIDPENHTAVIFLTNRVHPYDKGSQVRLRSLLANIVAGSIIEY